MLKLNDKIELFDVGQKVKTGTIAQIDWDTFSFKFNEDFHWFTIGLIKSVNGKLVCADTKDEEEDPWREDTLKLDFNLQPIVDFEDEVFDPECNCSGTCAGNCSPCRCGQGHGCNPFNPAPEWVEAPDATRRIRIKQDGPEPDNNDGRSSCWWCKSPTKEIGGAFNSVYNVCTNSKCGR